MCCRRVLPLGIIAGLFIGKPLGISLFCWLALKLKLASLPSGTTFGQIMAVGVLCGIGFTMSIFISTLAFGANAPELIVWAKLGILIGSLLAAVIGYTLLGRQVKDCRRPLGIPRGGGASLPSLLTEGDEASAQFQPSVLLLARL